MKAADSSTPLTQWLDATVSSVAAGTLPFDSAHFDELAIDAVGWGPAMQVMMTADVRMVAGTYLALALPLKDTKRPLRTPRRKLEARASPIEPPSLYVLGRAHTWKVDSPAECERTPIPIAELDSRYMAFLQSHRDEYAAARGWEYGNVILVLRRSEFPFLRSVGFATGA